MEGRDFVKGAIVVKALWRFLFRVFGAVLHAHQGFSLCFPQSPITSATEARRLAPDSSLSKDAKGEDKQGIAKGPKSACKIGNVF